VLISERLSPCTSFEGDTEISAKSSNVLPCPNPRQITVKLKATIIVAALLAATAAHAETIDLKCWARGLTGGERNSVYINGV